MPKKDDPDFEGKDKKEFKRGMKDKGDKFFDRDPDFRDPDFFDDRGVLFTRVTVCLIE
jgi:hypothetical protein